MPDLKEVSDTLAANIAAFLTNDEHATMVEVVSSCDAVASSKCAMDAKGWYHPTSKTLSGINVELIEILK
jgi:hypothetical protein